MKRTLFFLCLMVCCYHAFAQECYKQTRQRGIELYNAGKKEAAQKAFQTAKTCPDKPVNNDLDTWISRCKKVVQREKCYDIKYKEAISFYEAGDKQSAKDLFMEARNCWDKPKQNDLNDWISKCEVNETKPKEADKSSEESSTPTTYVPYVPYVRNNPIILLSGTSVPLKSNHTIYAKRERMGNKIYFTVTEDIKEQDRIVIPKGSTAVGIVRKAKRSSAFGTKGKLHIEMSHINVGNRTIKLNNKMLKFYGKNNTPVAVIAGLCFTPCFFITGTKAYMPANYEFTVTIMNNESFYFGVKQQSNHDSFI